jgi:hypothetical protein
MCYCKGRARCTFSYQRVNLVLGIDSYCSCTAILLRNCPECPRDCCIGWSISLIDAIVCRHLLSRKRQCQSLVAIILGGAQQRMAHLSIWKSMKRADHTTSLSFDSRKLANYSIQKAWTLPLENVLKPENVLRCLIVDYISLGCIKSGCCQCNKLCAAKSDLNYLLSRRYWFCQFHSHDEAVAELAKVDC